MIHCVYCTVKHVGLLFNILAFPLSTVSVIVSLSNAGKVPDMRLHLASPCVRFSVLPHGVCFFVCVVLSVWVGLLQDCCRVYMWSWAEMGRNIFRKCFPCLKNPPTVIANIVFNKADKVRSTNTARPEEQSVPSSERTQTVLEFGVHHRTILPGSFALDRATLGNNPTPKHCCHRQPGEKLSLPPFYLSIALSLSLAQRPSSWSPSSPTSHSLLQAMLRVIRTC